MRIPRFSLFDIPVLVAIAVFAAAFFVLHPGGEYAQGFFPYYLNLVFRPSLHFMFSLLWFLALAAAVRLAFLMLSSGLQGKPAAAFLSSLFVFRPAAFAQNIKKNLKTGILLLLGLAAFGGAIGQLNLFNASRLKDELLASFDFALFGSYPFFTLGSLAYPDWFLRIVEICFLYLGFAMVVSAAYLFLFNKGLLQEMVAAFFVGSLIAFAGWFLVPAMSPHNRFIDNVTKAPVSYSVQQGLEKYAPHQGVREFQKTMRERADSLDIMPTTPFPSAHVIWGALLAYYSFRVSRWLLLGALPFVALSTFGTVLFAQHYFVDIPAGLLVGIVSILGAEFLRKKVNPE